MNEERIPDIIENMEAAAEANHEFSADGNEIKCVICEKFVPVDSVFPISDNPWAPPACTDCLEKEHPGFHDAVFGKKKKCLECDGTGKVDSGGQTPWGAWIEIDCPYCKGKGKL